MHDHDDINYIFLDIFLLLEIFTVPGMYGSFYL